MLAEGAMVVYSLWRLPLMFSDNDTGNSSAKVLSWVVREKGRVTGPADHRHAAVRARLRGRVSAVTG